MRLSKYAERNMKASVYMTSRAKQARYDDASGWKRKLAYLICGNCMSSGGYRHILRNIKERMFLCLGKDPSRPLRLLLDGETLIIPPVNPNRRIGEDEAADLMDLLLDERIFSEEDCEKILLGNDFELERRIVPHSSLSCFLRRFALLRYGVPPEKTGNTKLVVTVDGTEHVVSPLSEEVIPKEEICVYAELLWKLVKKDKDAVCEKLIQKKTLISYLGNGPYERKQLFIMSIALGMDGEEFSSLMQMTRESPVYNTHSVQEMICRTCHAVPEMRNARTYLELMSRAEEICSESALAFVEPPSEEKLLSCIRECLGMEYETALDCFRTFLKDGYRIVPDPGLYRVSRGTADSGMAVSLALRDLLFRRCGTGASPEGTVSLVFGNGRYTVKDLWEDIPSEETAEICAELLKDITAFMRTGNGEKCSEPYLIEKKEYRRLLKKGGCSQNELPDLSAALGMSGTEFVRFMNLCGKEYHFDPRSLKETVLRACREVPSFRNTVTFRRLMDDMKATAAEAVPMSRDFISELDGILLSGMAPGDIKEAFTEFMTDNAVRFCGYSDRARELFAQQLNEPCPVGMEFAYIDGLSAPGITEADSRPSSFYFRKWDPDVFPGMRRWDPKHFTYLLAGREPVTKNDLLLLRVLKLDRYLNSCGIEYEDLSGRQIEKLEEEFRSSSDSVLSKAGLPPIYVGNLFDSMILMAVLSDGPRDYIERIFQKKGEI